MKRLSDLPERDRTDETQQLMGDNPVKLLAATPTEDVLVKPEDMMANITDAAGSSDTWARLEQVKEAYEKGPEFETTWKLFDNTTLFSKLNDTFPHWISEDESSAVVYLPNTILDIKSMSLRNSLFPANVLSSRLEELNLTYKNLSQDGSNSRLDYDKTFFAKKIKITITGNSIAYVPKMVMYTNMANVDCDYTIFCPNATSLGNMLTDSYYNLDFTKLTFRLICPNITNIQDTFKLSGGDTSFKRQFFNIYVYFPKINASFEFFKTGKVKFDSIKYLLDNINKAPTVDRVQQTYFSFFGAIPADTGKINWTLSDGTTGSAYIPEVDVTGATEKEKIVEAINNDSVLKQYVEAYAGSSSTIYIRAKAAKNITYLEVTSPSSIIIPPTNPPGSTEVIIPLVIDCGVDESLGEYADPDAKTGWTPTGDLATTVTNFFTACENKWTINWHPIA